MSRPEPVENPSRDATTDDRGLCQTIAQAAGAAAKNAVSAQQQATAILQAATTQGVNILYSIDSPEITRSTVGHSLITQLKEAQSPVVDASAGMPQRARNLSPDEDLRAFSEMLTALNDVAVRQAFRTIELAAVTIATARLLRAQSNDQVAGAKEILATIKREMSEWLLSV